MSRHEGVSCDSCLKNNFRGRRYKCLICYDYDLCSSCYETGAATTHHSAAHPMQCILTRSDHDLFYGGEAVLGASHEAPQSYTCPICARLGFTETTLVEHVATHHTESSVEVVCPICAAMPGGDPNHVTTDFSAHLALEHRSGPRDLISFLDEPSGPAGRTSAGVRRVPHSRGVGGTSRTRRAANHHHPQPPSGSLSSNLSFGVPVTAAAGSRDSIDPIAELLSQLSGVRRSATSSSASQLQQLQMQLERQQARLEQRAQQMTSRVAAGSRPGFTATFSGGGGSASSTTATISSYNAAALASGANMSSQHLHHHHHPFGSSGGAASGVGAATRPTGDINSVATASGVSASGCQFLLRQSSDEDDVDDNSTTRLGVNKKSQFVQELVLSTLLKRQLGLTSDDLDKKPDERKEEDEESESDLS